MNQRSGNAASRARAAATRTLTNARDWLTGAPDLQRSERTAFEIVHRLAPMTLRHYPPLAEPRIGAGDRTVPVAPHTYPTPVVLVPPLAARPMAFDLLPDRSLVRYLRARGFSVYLIDWGEPGRAHAHLGLRDYALRLLPDALTAVRAHSGEPDLSLVAYCMGGLFALIHAGAGHDGGLRNLVTVATPVDMHADMLAARPLRHLKGPARLIRRATRRAGQRLDPAFTHMPGWFNALVFKATDPIAAVASHLALLRHLSDREAVAEQATTGRWAADMLDYPGALVQEVLSRLFIDNALGDGRMRLGRVDVDLARIDSALLAIAGDADHLAGRASVRRLMDLVASRDRRFLVAPGGHAGVFAGRRAPLHTWPAIADWLAARSD